MRLAQWIYVLMVSGGILFVSITGKAQQGVTFGGNFEGVSYQEFFQSIERSTGYKVYYDEAQFVGLRINLRITEQSLSGVLNILFENTDYYYAIDHLGNIFITKGVYLQDKLPNNYFDVALSKDSSDVMREMSNVRSELQTAIQNKLNIIGRVTEDFMTGNATIFGIIVDAEKGQPIVGAAVFCEEVGTGMVTDQSGKYSLTLPKGIREVSVSTVGYRSSKYRVALYGDGELDLFMNEEVSLLNEVVIESERGANIKGMQMGFEKLDIKAMKSFSAIMGEVDILRVILALPGVQTVGEASTGLNVRGGSADQNLILYNNAVVYNPTHLFGFFTAFNPDEIQSTELIKSGIPAELGGRLSSVIDISSRSGSAEKFVATGGIGPLTGKLTLEGPLIKDKTSILIGARSSYSNWLLSKVPDRAISNSRASFHDMNMNVNHTHNQNNSLLLSVYRSGDKFKFNDDSLYHYNNLVASLNWKHTFSDRLNSLLVLSHSGYDYSITGEESALKAFKLSYSVNQADVKGEFNFLLNERHSLLFGFNSTLYTIKPGKMEPLGDSSLISLDNLQRERAVESALFIGDNFEITPRLSVYGGLRYSFFTALGPKSIYKYPNGLPKKVDTISDTLFINSGPVATYHGPEYRFSIKYILAEDLSVKASYNLTRQYLHIMSNSISVSPTDVWKISDTHIKPQLGSQMSVGVYKNFKSGKLITSLEGYYKKMKNSLDYKDGANLILNHTIEADVLNASGLAFGAELMLKKPAGKLNGWVSYTYSRTYLRTASEFAGELVNGGHYYPSNYDKPHAANLVGNYKLSHRFSLSLNTTYSTGRPITLPLAKYQLEEATRLFYSERNQYRLPDYFRIDVSVNLEGNHKIKKLAHGSWTFGVYNLTGRKNIYSVYFRSEDDVISGYKMAIFGSPIPSVTYNFRF
jgi:hypothetical protein